MIKNWPSVTVSQSRSVSHGRSGLVGMAGKTIKFPYLPRVLFHTESVVESGHNHQYNTQVHNTTRLVVSEVSPYLVEHFLFFVICCTG